MEYDEAPNNVHALFPGIETAPFGRAAALDELSDEGWSATPERTLLVDDDHACDRRPAAGRGYNPRKAAVAAVLVALLAGAGLGVGNVLLTPAGRSGSPPAASDLAASAGLAGTSDASHRELAWASARDREFVAHRGRRGSGARHETSRGLGRRHRTSSTAAGSASGSAVATPSEQPATVPVVDTPATYASSAGGGNGASDSSSSQGAQPAGPTGRVALIGAGTTPSG